VGPKLKGPKLEGSKLEGSKLGGSKLGGSMLGGGASVRRDGPMLELRELVKHYPALGGEPVRAVDGVSLTVDAGEMVALYGPSGSGKTTLLLMIATLLAPTSGEVLIGGRDTSSLSERQASRFRLSELGFIRQSFDLLGGVSAIDNATLKLLGTMRRRNAQREIEPLLVRLGLGERLHHRAETLSMGERQRVMIARALSTEPRLLLADEPTGSLDTQRGSEVLDLLRELCRERGVAVVLVSHDPMAARYAHRVLALRDGRLGPYEIDASAGTEDGRPAGASPASFDTASNGGGGTSTRSGAGMSTHSGAGGLPSTATP
jgi:putative ABC transport system ATP-binding protein